MSEEVNNPIIITDTQQKGGVGKTVLTFNFSNYLAIEHDKRVLVIDMDELCNSSQVFGVYDQEGTVANILKGEGQVKIHSVRPNIDLIAGHLRLHDVQEDIAMNHGKDMMLYMWLEDNFDTYDIGQYDFIVIDTHNDFGTATRNAIAVSHIIFAPVIPVDFSNTESLKFRLDEYKNEIIDFKTRESYITAELKFVGNMIRNTNNGKEFEDYIDNNPEYVAKFKFLDDYNKTIQQKKSISEKLQSTRDKAKLEFKQEFDKNMKAMYQAAIESAKE